MYDCLIIGGGLSGLTCGIKCAKEGLRTVIISNGMNSLHFSSGSIDLLGYSPKHEIITKPYKYLKKLKKSNPTHPYSKIPLKIIKESFEFFKNEMAEEGLVLYDNAKLNHFHITGMGILKPTYFSQESVFNEDLKRAIERNARIAILNFDGFRDYYPELAVEQLKKNKLMKNTVIKTGKVKLPFFKNTGKSLLDSRSIDLARIFETEKYLPRIAEEIKKVAGEAEIVSLPAFIGINNYKVIHKRLSELTGLLISEVPTLPPSILGLRLDNSLKSRFASLGGEFTTGDKITGGRINRNNDVDHVHTKNYGNTQHHSRFYVLSTGSFFSGGLHSGFNQMDEPIFGLKFVGKKNRDKWYSKDFFDHDSHPFLSYGVNTNNTLNPYNKNGEAVENLFCTGAVLAGYNPIKEGSGGGIAISTGYYAAQKIIKEINK